MLMYKKNLKISVLIIFHNEKRTIKKTLEHVFAQNYPREYFEIIAIDDGSTDNSAQIAKDFGIKKIIRINHGGISMARNIGLKYCQGDVILFIDAHVYLNQNALYLINKTLKENPKYTGVCGRYFATESYDRNYIRDIRRQIIFKKNDKPFVINMKNFTPFSIAVGAIYKSLFHKFLFPLGFKDSYGEDVYLQILAHNANCVFYYEPSIIGIHDAEINYETLFKKMLLETRSMSNILFYASLLKKRINVPYLHYFLSYPLILMLLFILFFVNKAVFVLPLFFMLLLEIKDAVKCFFIKNYKFTNKLEAFVYLIIKEIINGFYTPFYLIYHKKITLKQTGFIVKQIFKWEIMKLTNIF